MTDNENTDELTNLTRMWSDSAAAAAAAIADIESSADEMEQMLLEQLTEMRRFRQEVIDLRAERDEARRMYCFEKESPSIVNPPAEMTAVRLEWDCYPSEEAAQ